MAQSPDERLILALRQNDETRDVDYKAAMAWDEKDKATCCSIVKDILAMANTGGGLLVFGVDQRADGSFDPSGVPDHMRATWETTRINNFLQKYTDPPINTRTRRFTDNGKTFVAIDVPPFPNVPHLCVKDYPGELTKFTLYVRTANNESAPIGSSADFSAIIEQAVRNRSDRLLSSFRTILVGANVTASISDAEQFDRQLQQARQRVVERQPDGIPAFEGFRQVAWWPARFDVARFRQDDLRHAVKHSRVSYREQPFLETSASQYAIPAMQEGIEAMSAYSMPFPAPMDLRYYVYDYWQLLQSGFFFKSSLMKEESLTERIQDRLILWDETACFVGEAVDCLARLYQALGVEDEDVTVQVRVTGTQGRTVGRSGIWLPTIHERSALSEVRYQVTHPLEDWQAGRIELSAEMTRELMLRFNWLDAPSFDAPIKQLFDYQLR